MYSASDETTRFARWFFFSNIVVVGMLLSQLVVGIIVR